MKILGIDEAGRGPVIGSLFMAGVLMEGNINELKKIGVKDSKLLKHEDRIEMAEKIREIAEYKVIEVTPKEIDEAVESEDSNLNFLEGETIVRIINKLNPDEAYIDCPSVNTESFKEFLQSKIKKNVKLIVEHKMDAKNLLAGAASILAKVAREENVLQIEEKVKESIGSGYPSNKVCKDFLKRNYDKYPGIIRKSWASYKNIIKEKGQKNLGDY
tara:strand:+ start:626 stop:1270 length:645 start_codon:yes stop_codon:yes gene_type:complete